jgi:CRISPR-associated protein Csb2
VHGHGGDRSELRRARFSYLPLPTITPLRTEGIARVVVVATPGLHAELAWVKAHLAGRELIWKGEPMALLEPLPATDGVLPHYRAMSDCWSTVTPVVLPGHDDHSGKKAERLLRTAFLQAGFEPEVVDSIRELAWQREGFRAGVDLANRYLAPDKVRGSQFHVRVRFATRVSGPIAIGSGRHRGMGVFARAPG